jgi:hypothetical protein
MMELYLNSKTEQTAVKHNQKVSKHTCASNLYDLPTRTNSTNQKKSVDHNLVTTEMSPCPWCTALFGFADRSSIIVASLRRRNNVVPLYCYVTVLMSRCYGNLTITRNSIILPVIPRSIKWFILEIFLWNVVQSKTWLIWNPRDQNKVFWIMKNLYNFLI